MTDSLTRAEFGALAKTHRLIPVARTLFADAETPVGVYRKLARERPGTFLLESAEPGRSFSRWSFVGVNAVASLSVVDGEASWTGTPPPDLPTSGDPLAVLGAAWRALKGTRLPGLPPLTGGFVGYLAYDVVRRIETLPEKAVDELGLPELQMLLVTDLAAVDHHECTVVLIANGLVHSGLSEAELDAAYTDAVARLDAMQDALAAPATSTVGSLAVAAPKEALSRTPAGQYQPAVEQALEAVRAGEVFQIQVSQRFCVPTTARPLDVYRVLRTLNPSPYMYFLRLGDVDIVGCSPEALVTVSGRQASLHPIAGTRRRGETAEQDAALAAELVSDPKEQAEHVMLVDLARNDLGRVSTAGTVEVVEFGAVERYSHVWHIVSTVQGEVEARQGCVRRAHRELPGRHSDRGAEGAGDGTDRGTRTGPPWHLRRRRRLPRCGRRPRHGHRDPHRGDDRRHRVRAGRGRDRRRQHPGPRGTRVAQQGPRGSAGHRHGGDTAADPRRRKWTDAPEHHRGVMTSARYSLAAAIAADLLGAVGVLFFAGAKWQRVVVGRARPLPDAVANLSGRDLHGGTTAFALIALAGVVAIAATRGWARRLVGLVLAAAGAVVVWYSIDGITAVSASQARAAHQRGRRRFGVPGARHRARDLAGAHRHLRRRDRARRGADRGLRGPLVGARRPLRGPDRGGARRPRYRRHRPVVRARPG